jgi:hypothetical protein
MKKLLERLYVELCVDPVDVFACFLVVVLLILAWILTMTLLNAWP